MPISKITPLIPKRSLLPSDMQKELKNATEGYLNLLERAQSAYADELGRKVLNPFLDKATQEKNNQSLISDFTRLFREELGKVFPRFDNLKLDEITNKVVTSFSHSSTNSERIAKSKPAKKYVALVNSLNSHNSQLSKLSESTQVKEQNLEQLRAELTKAEDGNTKSTINAQIKALEAEISSSYGEQSRMTEEVCMPLYTQIAEKRQTLFNDFRKTVDQSVNKQAIDDALNAIFGEMPEKPNFVPRFANLLLTPKQKALNSQQGQEFITLRNRFNTSYATAKRMAEPLDRKLNPLEEQISKTKDPQKRMRYATQYNRIIDQNADKVEAYNQKVIESGRLLQELKSRAAELTNTHFDGDSKAFEDTFGTVQNLFVS